MMKTIAILLVSLLLMATGVYAVPSADRDQTKFMKFRAGGPESSMIDGLHLTPDKDSFAFGMLKKNGKGKVYVFLRGINEDGEIVTLAFFGKVTKFASPNENTDSINNVYEIVVESRMFGVQKGGNPARPYVNGIMELTYNPETNIVNINSITGELHESRFSKADTNEQETQLGKTNAHNLS